MMEEGGVTGRQGPLEVMGEWARVERVWRKGECVGKVEQSELEVVVKGGKWDQGQGWEVMVGQCERVGQALAVPVPACAP